MCRCGKVGCLETGASGSALHEMILEKLAEGRPSTLSRKYLAGEKITLDDIAARGRVSRTMCNNLFKKFAGNSPFEELTKVRLRKVSEYLTDSSFSMSDIATMTGFSSANYMTELFKREYGMSPREYRNGLS